MKRQISVLTLAFVFCGAPAWAQNNPGQKAAPSGQPSAQSPASGAAGTLTTTKQKASYGIGMSVGESIKSDSLEVDMPSLIKGIADSISGAKPALSDKELQDAMQQFQKEQTMKISDKNKKEGEKYLAENKSKEGVKTTASGLQYKVVKAGSGATPGPTDEITAHYKGTLLDGKTFDSSYDRGQPIHLRADKVIKGWSEALQLMKVGDKWQLVIPSNLAYGEEGAGNVIGPNAVLLFDVELLDVKKGQPEGAMQLQPMNPSK